jgi:spermidine synthase
MALHPHPHDVLLVGGGLSGALGELYKYNLTSREYVELDPVLIKIAEDVIGKGIKEELKEPLLKIQKGDGRFYIKNNPKKYDLIILAIPAPHTVQLNRFYTKEFFTEAKRHLSKNGILSLSCEGGENYIGSDQAEYLGSVYRTLCAAGFIVKIIPGENIKFVATPDNPDLQIDPKSLQRTLDERQIKTTFIRDYYLWSDLSPEKMDYVQKRITNIKKSQINTDFKPISYYYDIVLWATSFQPLFKGFLKILNEKILWGAVLFISLFILLLGKGKERVIRKSVIIAVSTTGFAQMAIELTIMLTFQAIYGYLYYKLAIFVTLFMAGLFAGGFLISKKMDFIANPLALFKKSKIGLSLFSLCLIPIFQILSDKAPFSPVNTDAGVVFPILVFVTGVIGGMQFSLATKVLIERGGEMGRISGFLYGADLIGGVAGALLLSAIFIPILGIFQCIIATAILNFASAVIITSKIPPKQWA